MQRGKLDQKITLRQRPTAKSGSGADIPQAPVDVATVWAEITEEPGGRAESLTADVLATITRYKVKIAYLAVVDEANEILWGVRVLDIIQAPDLGPRPRYRTLIAEERR